MTSSQLREILKSNLLVLASARDKSFEALSDLVETGAHVLVAPPCPYMDEAEAEAFKTVVDAAGEMTFVAAEIDGSSDLLDESGGELSYDEYYDKMLAQGAFLENLGASFLVLTGYHDILTAKCAVFALKEATELPICVGMTLGADFDIPQALSMLISLQALDVCAVGSTGMDLDESLELLSELQAFTTVPLFSIAKTEGDLSPEIYGDYVQSFSIQKCAMVGLLSDRMAYVAEALKMAWQLPVIRPDFPLLYAACSRDRAMFMDFHGNIISRNKQLVEIKTESFEELMQALELINRTGAEPVCFNIQDIDVLEYAIMHYAGRPAVRSDEYGEITGKEYGALILQD